MTIASCFIESDGKVLVVARHNPRTQTNEWDIPADKVAENESSEAAATRVIAAETGFYFLADDLIPLGSFDFISANNEPYTMRVFRINVGKSLHQEQGTLHNEWITPSDCLKKTDLIKNFANLIKLVGYSE